VGIQIGASVGRNGINAPTDVVAIGGALVGIGVDSGGVFAPPLSIEGLAEAITLFQSVQGLLAQPDGRIDPNGNSLRRLNAHRGLRNVPSALGELRGVHPRSARKRSLIRRSIPAREQCCRVQLQFRNRLL